MIDALGISLLSAAGMLGCYFLGGLVKGGLGFGLPIVTIATTPLFVPVDLAIATNAIVLPLTNIVQIRQAGGLGTTLGRYWPLIAMLCLTMPLGAYFGRQVSAGALTLALGLTIVAFTIFQWLNPRLAITPRLERPMGVLTGVMAGGVGGLVTINGPFFILYLVGLGVDRREMLSALGVFFLLTGLLLAGSFVAVGLLDGPRALWALVCVPPAYLGMALGNAVARRLPQETFRSVVLAGLLILGTNIALRGLAGG